MTRRAQLAGAAALAAGLFLIGGAVTPLVPSESPLGPVARVLDSMAPFLLGIAALLGVLSIVCGLRWLGRSLVLGAILALGGLIATHARVSLPLVPERQPDLRVIFLNAFGRNAAYADRIATSIIAADPDIFAIAEASAMYPALPRLRAHFPFVSPCDFEDCELLIVSKHKPVRWWRLTLNSIWDDRYAVVELKARNGKPVFLAVSHLVKPWFSGVSEVEMARLEAQYDWLSGPVVAVGDFNTAPWSQPMHHLLKATGYKALRRPLATWPVWAGVLGVPIDHVLVHNGARVVRASRFGLELNSNHAGLLVDIALPEDKP